MRFQLLFWFLVFMIVTGCSSHERAEGEKKLRLPYCAPDLFSDTSAFPRIYVYSNGNIDLNGRNTDLETLERKIAEVKRNETIVFYSSDEPSEHPPKEGPVAELFKKYKVGIRTYTDKTYTKSYN